MPFGPWSYADIEEMMREMEKDFMDIEKEIPKDLVRERRAEDGSVSKEIGPIVYGYSVTVGPDGKPVIREFGNIRRGPSREWKEAITDIREPLVDMVEGEKDIRVIAELPGASKKDIVPAIEGVRGPHRVADGGHLDPEPDARVDARRHGRACRRPSVESSFDGGADDDDHRADREVGQARDALTARRVFGDPIERDGTLILPVASVMGGAGGGGGATPRAAPGTRAPRAGGCPRRSRPSYRNRCR